MAQELQYQTAELGARSEVLPSLVTPLVLAEQEYNFQSLVVKLQDKELYYKQHYNNKVSKMLLLEDNKI